MTDEYSEYMYWIKKVDKEQLKRNNERRCYLCGKIIPRSNVYCYNCQEEIDNALCDYDHWPYDSINK